MMSSDGGTMQPADAESTMVKASGPRDRQAHLRQAFADDELVLLGQSIVPLDASSQLPFRLELLVRLRKEGVSLQPPSAFFPALETSGMMPMLDRWVVARACGWWRDRNSAGSVLLHINLASQSLEDGDFAEYVLTQLHWCQMPAAAVCFEFPVTDVASASAHYLATVEKLKAAGCGLAIAGFSRDAVSLEALRVTGASLIKLDDQMVQAVAEDAEACSRLRSLHRLCGKAGVRTAAEFVERSETLSRLREIGVDYAQGYGIARPEALPDNEATGVKTLPFRRPATGVTA